MFTSLIIVIFVHEVVLQLLLQLLSEFLSAHTSFSIIGKVVIKEQSFQSLKDPTVFDFILLKDKTNTEQRAQVMSHKNPLIRITQWK